MPRTALLVAVALLVTGACSKETDAPSRLAGPIIELDIQEEMVKGFTMEARGREWEILTDPEVNYGFDLLHLKDHLDPTLPVAVRLEERDGDLYALSIEDL